MFPPEGFVQAGKLRRSRPVLGKLDSSSGGAPSAKHDRNLPPGCTIVDRNPFPALAVSATAGGGSDADPVKTSKGMTKPLLAPSGQASDGDGVVATGRSPPAAASSGTTSETRQCLGGTLDVTATQHTAPAGTRPTLRYNPGPTFRKARGRKRKALLDPSKVTEGSTIGTKELNALLKDDTLQQVSS